MEEKAKRTRRTPQQIADDIDVKIQELNESIKGIEAKKAAAIEEFDAKIENVKQRIAGLEAKKKEALAPPKPKKPRMTKKQKMAALLKKAEKAGLKPEEIAEKLGRGAAVAYSMIQKEPKPVPHKGTGFGLPIQRLFSLGKLI